MMLIGRSHDAVFLPPHPLGKRVAFSEQRVQGAVKLRASARVRVRCQRRDRDRGYELHVEGVLFLRGPQIRILFRPGSNGEIDDSASPVLEDLVMLPVGTSLKVPVWPIPCPGPVSPLVWLSFVNFEHMMLSSPACIGRVESQPLHVDPVFEIPALATTWIAARKLSSKGPVLDVSGGLTLLEGVLLRVAMAPGCNLYGAPTDVMGTYDLELAGRGGTLAFPQRRLTSLVRGHPLVSMVLRDWNGSDACGETPVGWLAEVT